MEAVRLYVEKYSNHFILDLRIFSKIHRRLALTFERNPSDTFKPSTVKTTKIKKVL